MQIRFIPRHLYQNLCGLSIYNRECLEQNTAGLGIDFLTWLAQQQEAARPGSSASQVTVVTHSTDRACYPVRQGTALEGSIACA